MEPSTPYRPRVSRETRLLLTAGVLAIAALWFLARLRFQESPRDAESGARCVESALGRAEL